MDLFTLAAKLTLDSSDYNSGIGKAESKLEKVAGFAKKAGTIMAGTLATATGYVTALTKQATEAYSEYEQLVGGIETLYKSSVDEAGSAANKMLENAQNAYETAGMSANEYLETVSTFSAALIKSTGRGEQQDLAQLKSNLDEEYKETKRSLEDQYAERKSYWDEQIRLEKNKSKKQSLKEARDAELKELKRSNEDTLAELKAHNKQVLAEAEEANQASETSEESLQRASDLANMAVIDMSDNANKMGTDIESIQNAYAGFAKQNYTMLDNLKLGYSATKEGMEQLLKDAERLTGKEYDISSYADIVEAIHAVQTEMGISGLTAEEAADMVEKGLLTEEEAYEKMGTTAKEAQTTIEGSSKAMKAAWQNMLVTFADKKGDTKKATQNLVRTAKTYYKNISPVITQAISGIGDFFAEIAPMIGEELPKMIVDIVPKLFNAGKKLVSGLVKGAKSAISKTQVATWLGMADENGNIPEDVTWGDIGKRIIERIKEKISEAKIKIADLLGIDDPEEATWGQIASNIKERISNKLHEAKIKLAQYLGVEDASNATWGQIATKVKDRISNRLNSAKIKLAQYLGVEDANNATWGQIANNITTRIKIRLNNAKIKLAKYLGVENPQDAKWTDIATKLKERIKGAIKTLKFKLADMLGISKETVGGEVEWEEIGREVIGKLTTYFSKKGSFLKKLILGDEYTDESTWSDVGTKISGWISEAFQEGGLIDTLLGNGAERLTAMAELAGQFMISLANWVGQNSGTIVQILTAVITGLVQVIPELVKVLCSVIQNPTFQAGVIELAKTVAIAVWELIKTLGKEVADGLGITEAAENARVRWTGAYKAADEFFGGAGYQSKLYNAKAEALGTGFGDIASGKKSRADWEKELRQALTDAEYSAENISEIMEYFGRFNPFNSEDVKQVKNELKKLTVEGDPYHAFVDQIGEMNKYYEDNPVDVDVGVNEVDPKERLKEAQKLVDENPLELKMIIPGVYQDKYGNIINASDLQDEPLEGSFSNAKGNWNVPYDDFVANLHRGEMVLTASQARRYRDGDGSIDMDSLATTIAHAVKEAIETATIRSYLNGRDITDEVNRNNMQSIKARRYAT